MGETDTKVMRIGRLNTEAEIRAQMVKLYKDARRPLGRNISTEDAYRLCLILDRMVDCDRRVKWRALTKPEDA